MDPDHEQAKPTHAVTEIRGTGQTYKLLLKAVLAATDHDNFLAVLVAPNHAIVLNALEQLATITRPLGGFAQVSFVRHRATFINGSGIQFLVPAENFIGLRPNLVLVDESWYRLNPNPLAAKWLDELRNLENRYGVQTGVDSKPKV